MSGWMTLNMHDPIILTVSAVYALICILHGLIFFISRSLNTNWYMLAVMMFTSVHMCLIMPTSTCFWCDAVSSSMQGSCHKMYRIWNLLTFSMIALGL